MKLITSESVSFGHPDKIADQISDALLDAYLEQDQNSKVAIETMVKDNMVIVGGEVKSNAIIDIKPLIMNLVKDIGYTDPEHGFYYKNLSIINIIGEQSNEINKAVEAEELGAGDQGFMVGYATNETSEYMPLGIYISRKIVNHVVQIGFGPDAKSQTTIEHNDNNIRIHTILVSVCHKSDVNVEEVREKIKDEILSNAMNLDKKVFELIDNNVNIVINPAGSWNVGGPVSDCGLTGRKIVVDQYGPYCPVGGGAFCFAGDTIVKMEHEHKRIDEIIKGDMIWTLNETTNKTELKEVNDIYTKTADDSYDLLEITLENGEILKITENHEIKTNRGWIKAKDINNQDEIVTFYLCFYKIKKIEKIEKEKTYDLNIKDNHNYFVSDSEILVHNSGKDFSKVDRSGAYLARYIAKNIVATGIANKCKIEIAYMIGVAEPASLSIDTFGMANDEKLLQIVKQIFPLKPKEIIDKFNLKTPIYQETAKNGHFGHSHYAWEQLDKVKSIVMLYYPNLQKPKNC